MAEQWIGATINGTVTRVYDNNFHIDSLQIDETPPVDFNYDKDGLVTKAGVLEPIHYTNEGLLKDTTLGNTTDSWTYSKFGEVETYSAEYNGGLLYEYSIPPPAASPTGRDQLGRIKRKVETIGALTTTYDYAYDTAGRLDTVTEEGLLVADYDYDHNGNRTTAYYRGAAVEAEHDDQDRLLSYSVDGVETTYTYTDNGERQSKLVGSATTTYTYDALGNLRNVVLPNGTPITYLVDGRSRRIGKKVDGIVRQVFLYKDQLNPVAELDGAGNLVSEFVYATKPNVPDYMIHHDDPAQGQTTTYRIISDHLGSVRLVVNVTDGTIAQRIDYDEFGVVLQNTNPGFQPFGFAGGIYDTDTGLVRFGARDYDPQVGRWTAKDPIRFLGNGTNLYGYIFGDPVNFVDITGLAAPLGFGGVGARWHVGIIGGSFSFGAAAEGRLGKSTGLLTVCVRVGPGLFAGVEASGGGGTVEEGISDVEGFCMGPGADAGLPLAFQAGFQALFGSRSTTVGISGGLGLGLSGGVDFCYSFRL